MGAMINMEITLRRNVEVATYRAVAVIGKEDGDFRFLLRALQLAAENGGSITHKMINESLVFYPPEHEMGKRIISTLAVYKYLSNTSWNRQKNNEYELTDLGKEMLASNMMLIPESGPCLLHTIDDPLFEDNIIKCEYRDVKTWEEYDQTLDEIHKKVKKEAEDHKDTGWLDNYPKDDSDTPKKVHAIAVAEDLVIYKIDRPLIAVKPPGMKLKVSMTIAPDNEVEVHVYSGDKQKGVSVKSHTFTVDYVSVLQPLLGDRGESLAHLENGELVLLLPFNELSDAEKDNMASNIHVKRPEVYGFGRSEDVTVKGIRILPKTKKDAVLWAIYFLTSHIDQYTDKAAYERLVDECSAMFEEIYEASEVRKYMPGYDKFLDRLKLYKDKYGKQYWFMLAPKLLTMKRS